METFQNHFEIEFKLRGWTFGRSGSFVRKLIYLMKFLIPQIVQGVCRDDVRIISVDTADHFEKF